MSEFSDDALQAVIPVLKERERRAALRVEQLKDQMNAASDELADARGALAHIERLAGLNRPAPPPDRATVSAQPWLRRDPNGPAPEGLEAVAAVLQQSPKPLTLAELTEAVAQLGWRPETDKPERAVRAAANRLRKKSVDFEYRDKKFAYMPRHRDQLPPMLAGVGDFTDPEDDRP